MARGKFKGKPTGERTFSSEEQIDAGTSAGRPKSFKKKQDERHYDRRQESDDEDDRRQESDEEEYDNFQKNKHKGTEGLIEIENPNLVKPKNLKAKDIDIGRTSDLSRRES
uniref:Uncharacterized protein n=1 Tax=Leersia perrieri TaxID=77586 RepID=A0A0D9WIN4_9ORYZ